VTAAPAITTAHGLVVSDALLATFTDAGGIAPLTDYQATIVFGDGSPAAAGTIRLAAGHLQVTGSHVFTHGGRYGVQVTVATAGGSTATTSTSITLPSGVDAFVTQVYQDLFGRTVDSGGFNFWTGLLRSGLISRTQFVQALETTAEFRSVEINQLYGTLLGRQADTSGLGFFASILQAGGTVEQVKSMLLGSPEFLTHAGGTDTAFLAATYQELFNRPIDLGGQTFYLQQLAAGISRTRVALQILSSQEAENSVVNGYYEQVLVRAGDLGGVNFFAGDLQNHTLRDEAVLAALLASDEYFRQF